jgi:hypothetical protein
MVAGRKLRMLADDHFFLVWTLDDWKTHQTMESRDVGYAGHFADMETEPGKAGRLIFTLRWSLQDRWEGRNFEVQLDLSKQETGSAPASSLDEKDRGAARREQETEVSSKGRVRLL